LILLIYCFVSIKEMKMSNSIFNHHFQYRRQRTQLMSTGDFYLKYSFERTINFSDYLFPFLLANIHIKIYMLFYILISSCYIHSLGLYTYILYLRGWFLYKVELILGPTKIFTLQRNWSDVTRLKRSVFSVEKHAIKTFRAVDEWRHTAFNLALFGCETLALHSGCFSLQIRASKYGLNIDMRWDRTVQKSFPEHNPRRHCNDWDTLVKVYFFVLNQTPYCQKMWKWSWNFKPILP